MDMLKEKGIPNIEKDLILQKTPFSKEIMVIGIPSHIQIPPQKHFSIINFLCL